MRKVMILISHIVALLPTRYQRTARVQQENVRQSSQYLCVEKNPGKREEEGKKRELNQIEKGRQPFFQL